MPPTDATVTSTITKDLTWIKTHLILLAVVIILAVGSVYGVESLIANHDKAKSDELAQIAAQMAASNKQLQESTQAQLNTLAQQNAQLAAQTSVLAQALAVRQKVEVSIPAQNATLSAQEAARALGGSAVGDTVVLDLPTARNAVSDEQLVPLLQQDKSDLTKANGLLQAEVANGAEAMKLEQAAHRSDNTANMATLKAKDAELATVKAACRRSKLKWFFIGFTAGFIGREVLGTGALK